MQAKPTKLLLIRILKIDPVFTIGLVESSRFVAHTDPNAFDDNATK